MNQSDKIKVVKKLGGWERMAIFSGVILSVPLFTLLGTAVYALVTDRPDAHMGVLLTIISILVLWAIVWGTLWIVSAFREENGEENDNMDSSAADMLATLQEENTRLKKQLAELTKGK
ncbi:MAG: hypothetical protein HW386_2280 [Gammaproteobacteria bacterium]|nr:hypothetical protein [Gammaproteobacteria bacterium]